jgi:hypothetical protein
VYKQIKSIETGDYVVFTQTLVSGKRKKRNQETCRLITFELTLQHGKTKTNYFSQALFH